MNSQTEAALGKALDELTEAHFIASGALYTFFASAEAALCKAMGVTPDEAGKVITERAAARWLDNALKFDALKESAE